MTDTATLEANLAQARKVLHQLLTGASAVKVSFDGGNGTGRSVEYRAANVAELRAYIAEMEKQLGLPRTKGSRARRIVFG